MEPPRTGRSVQIAPILFRIHVSSVPFVPCEDFRSSSARMIMREERELMLWTRASMRARVPNTMERVAKRVSKVASLPAS